jgi:uncharacterized membrane protein
MFTGRIVHLTALFAWALIFAAAPAAAHEKHKHKDVQAAASQASNGNSAAPAIPATGAQPDHMAGMPDMDDEEVDRSKMGTGERLLNWLGRLHPIIIHFPLAFFPAALFTALVGRRRPAFAKPVQFLVVAGGIIAPIAMVLGWFDGGLIFTDTDPLLRAHRWLGTAIGLSALALAIWAWKRPEEDRRPGMMLGLAAITAALIVQGWYGGAMVHGIDHMNW